MQRPNQGPEHLRTFRHTPKPLSQVPAIRRPRVSRIGTGQNSLQLIARLASGSTSEVYLASDRNFDRVVAIKRLHYVGDENADKARILAALNHPYIVDFREFWQDQNGAFITMEYVKGETLTKMVELLSREDETIPLPIVCRIIIQVCEALQYIHAVRSISGEPVSIIHSDVSVQNIMVDTNCNTRLIDFGIAKRELQTDLTSSDFFKGNINCVAPEMFLMGDIDYRVDIYGLGLSLFEMLAQQMPFVFSASDSVGEIIRRIFEEEVPSVSRFNRFFPAEIDRIISKATATDREYRYQTVAEFAGAMRSFAATYGGIANSQEARSWMHEQYARRIIKRREFVEKAVTRARLADSQKAYGVPLVRETEPVARSHMGLVKWAHDNFGETVLGWSRIVGHYVLVAALSAFFVLSVVFVVDAFYLGSSPTRLSDEVKDVPHISPPPSPGHYKMRVTSLPGRADLYVDEHKVGSTGSSGIDIWLDPKQTHLVSIKKRGFRPYFKKISPGAQAEKTIVTYLVARNYRRR